MRERERERERESARKESERKRKRENCKVSGKTIKVAGSILYAELRSLPAPPGGGEWQYHGTAIDSNSEIGTHCKE